jgi:hypothetical protein
MNVNNAFKHLFQELRNIFLSGDTKPVSKLYGQTFMLSALL